MDNADNKVGITVKIDGKLRDEFNQAARADGFSPGSLIRNFIIRTVKESKASAN